MGTMQIQSKDDMTRHIRTRKSVPEAIGGLAKNTIEEKTFHIDRKIEI